MWRVRLAVLAAGGHFKEKAVLAPRCNKIQRKQARQFLAFFDNARPNSLTTIDYLIILDY